jgi:hypothetical protein
MTQKRVFPIDGSTVSHHAIITLAIRLSCSAVASPSRCQASLGGCSSDDDLARAIHAVHLEHILGEINADGTNVHVDDPLP